MFKVVVVEGGRRIDVGRTKTLESAKRLALSKVDDALPRNTVHVYDSDGIDVGHAGIGGDGEPHWWDNVHKADQ